MRACFISRLVWGLLIICTWSQLRAYSLPSGDWPRAEVYVESLSGGVRINESTPQRHQTIPAEGSTVYVPENAFVTLVFSTGLSLYCGPETQLTIKRARQEDLVSTYAADNHATTRSHIVIAVNQGTIGFQQPQPNPTSTLSLETHWGEIQSSADSFTLILTGTQNLVASLSGPLRFFPKNSPQRFVTSDEILNIAEASRSGASGALSPLHATDKPLLLPPAMKALHSAERVAYIVEGGTGRFVSVLRKEHLGGTAFNDHRFPR